MKGYSLFKLILLIFVLPPCLFACGVRAIPFARNDVEAAWAEVLNQYKRRADLIPNVVEVVKKYAAHERETLEAVVSARAKATQTNLNVDQVNPQMLQQFQQNQSVLSQALGRLMVVIEKYPDLKANQNFRDLQVQLEGTENRITVARNRYIESVNHFNKMISAPPESWTNGLFYHHEKLPQFEVKDQPDIDQPPPVQF